MYRSKQVRIFDEKDASDFLNERTGAMKTQIEGEADDYLLNVNEEDYVAHLVGRFAVEPLQIFFEQLSASTSEREVPAEHFPATFHVRPGAKYKKDVIKYHIPFTGSLELLQCTPNPQIRWSIPVTIEASEITFEILSLASDPEQIKREAAENISNIRRNFEYLESQVASFNNSISDLARRMFKGRKGHLLAKGGLLASLGVPIRRKLGVPDTFAIPAKPIKPRISIGRPEVHERGFKPEPTLDSNTYSEILKVMNDVGKQFERLPATYRGKDEEQLRDHFLLFLEPNFEGSATGETFNKTGKTDILLRYEGNNVFIAECKYWRGEKSYLVAVDQLLGYLTWRDSKAALVIFVQNSDFSKVLDTVKSATPRHNNFLRSYDQRDDTWLQYGLHLNGDRNREVKVAVLLFHIP